MDRQSLYAALQYPGQALGLDPEWQRLRPRFDIHLHGAVASTNQIAWQQVAQGAGSGTVVIAQQQVGGRGQRGRTWVSEPGGLYLSLVLEPELDAIARPLITLATAWGITAVLNHLGLPIGIKWPNDLVYREQKVGGILTETRSTAQTQAPVVIGMGLNWRNQVPSTGQRLWDLLPDPPPAPLQTLSDLAAIALRGTIQGYAHLHKKGASALIKDYQRYWVNQGQTVAMGGHQGTVLGVSKTGQLQVQLQTPDGMSVQTLNPGEIQLGYRAPG
jgi:BirA family biotin operon repressor/biotin-[acetyl-CoA-carboxylase] ligase